MTDQQEGMPSEREADPGSADLARIQRGNVYTMAESARLKGVSYHTVSRAVRRGKLPVQRLGRMALIAAEDLRSWRPMRERAPHKYRRREPNPDAVPALLDLASGERVDLAQRLSTLYEVIHSAAAERPLPDFLNLLCDRLADALDFRRVVIWGVDEVRQVATRSAQFGSPFSDLPNEVPLAQMPLVCHFLDVDEATVFEEIESFGLGSFADRFHITSLFAAPLRVGGRLLGVVFGDRNGEPLRLSRDQLGLAQVMSNQAALAMEQARLRAVESSRADQLAAVLEDLSEAVFACDADGRLTISNAADRALLGADEDQVQPGMDMLEVASLVDRREFDGRPIAPEETPVMRALAGQRVQGREFILIRPGDGSERIVSVSARPLWNGEAIWGAVAVARDITAERIAAQREAERLAQLEAAATRAAAVADVSLAVNSGTEVTTVLQTAIARMTELLGGASGALFFREPDGRMVGQAGYNFSDPPADELVLDPVSVPTTEAAFARREPMYYTYADATPSEQVYFDRYGFASAMIVPLIVHDDLLGVVYVNYADATHRPTKDDLDFAATLAGQCAVAIDKTRLMARSEAAHRRLLAVMDQLPQGVVIVAAPSGHLVLANRAAEELWGESLLEPGVAVSQLGLADADGQPFPPSEGPLERTLRTGEGRLGEPLTIKRPDGSEVTVLANHAPVTDAAGRIVGAVSVLQDMAQLRALDRAKDEFLSVVAHELRNPLTSLRGNLQLLARRIRKAGDPARTDELERLEGIIAQSDRMGELVNRLLDVSRADLGRLDLSFNPTDASAIVRGAVESARGLSKEHELLADTPERSPAVWDEVRIEQVLRNLLSNAVKYSPGGRVQTVLEDIKGGDWLRISVQDQGPGISDAAKAQLFDRYYRAQHGASSSEDEGERKGQGLGIGLYISRKIALAHGGDLMVEDAPGGGARFVLTLPRHAKAATSNGNQISVTSGASLGQAR